MSMTIDTSTPEGREKRTEELVEHYKITRNFGAITRLIGGSPRYDLQDYDDTDASGSHPDDRKYAD